MILARPVAGAPALLLACLLRRATERRDLGQQRIGRRIVRSTVLLAGRLLRGLAELGLEIVERFGDQAFARRRVARPAVVDLGGAAIEAIHEVRAFDIV